jgi:hypothetical protein
MQLGALSADGNELVASGPVEEAVARTDASFDSGALRRTRDGTVWSHVENRVCVHRREQRSPRVDTASRK